MMYFDIMMVYIFLFRMEIVTVSVRRKRRDILMENTNQFVENLHEKQKKDEQNRKRNDKSNASDKLPNKQH